MFRNLLSQQCLNHGLMSICISCQLFWMPLYALLAASHWQNCSGQTLCVKSFHSHCSYEFKLAWVSVSTTVAYLLVYLLCSHVQLCHTFVFLPEPCQNKRLTTTWVPLQRETRNRRGRRSTHKEWHGVDAWPAPPAFCQDNSFQLLHLVFL